MGKEASKTQKARGILALGINPLKGFSNEYVRAVRVYPHDPVGTFPFFARPCPMVPRHGFVESRMVASLPEWQTLLEEVAKSNEPEAEVVQMPFIHCQFSGVLNESGVSFGPGNDGVTGGQSARPIPAASPSLSAFYKSFQMESAATQSGITHSPYLEFVESNGKLEAVQLRNGPSVPLLKRYVPQAMTVKQVVQPSPDEIKNLLEWEKVMIEMKGKEGVVVWYPGGSMHSHVAVQAIEQTKGTASPFAVWLEETAPEIGETLLPCNEVAALTEGQLKELARMMASAVTSLDLNDDTDQSHAIQLAIAALHASPLWTGERHLLVLRAVAVAALLKFSSAAVLGELRHWNGAGPGKAKVVRRTEPMDEKERVGNLSRDQVYERAFKLHVSLLTPRLGTALLDFKTKGWSGSYGGKKWAGCTKATIELFNAASAFIGDPNSERWAAVMSAWNGTVNVFHNTGKFLNKFISAGKMDELAAVPVAGLVNSFVGQLAVRDEDFPLHRNPMRVAMELLVVVPKIEKVHVPLPVLSATTGPITFPAQWRFKSQTMLYVQIQLPSSVNKDYGLALEVYVASAKMRKILGTVKPDVTSLSNTATPYVQATVECQAGQWMLRVAQVSLWVPIASSKMDEAVKAVAQGPVVGELED